MKVRVTPAVPGAGPGVTQAVEAVMIARCAVSAPVSTYEAPPGWGWAQQWEKEVGAREEPETRREKEIGGGRDSEVGRLDT